jgi:hypothetical protein
VNVCGVGAAQPNVLPVIVAVKPSVFFADVMSSVSVPVVLNVWFVHVPDHVPARRAGLNFFGVAATADEAPRSATRAATASLDVMRAILRNRPPAA